MALAAVRTERDELADRVAAMEAAAASAQAPDSVLAEIDGLLQQASHDRRGLPDQAEQGYWSALDLAIQHRVRGKEGHAWDGLGACRWRAGDREMALKFFTRADRIADEVNDFWLNAWCLYNFGVYWRRAPAPAAAKDFFEQALAVADAHGCHAAAAWTHHEMAELARDQKDAQQEQEHYAQAARIGLDAGDDVLEGLSLMQLAGCAERADDPLQAAEHYTRVLQIGTRISHQDMIRDAEQRLAHITGSG